MKVRQGHQSDEIGVGHLQPVGQDEVEQEREPGGADTGRVIVPLEGAGSSLLDVKTMPVQGDFDERREVGRIALPLVLVQPVVHVAPRMETVLPANVLEGVGRPSYWDGSVPGGQVLAGFEDPGTVGLPSNIELRNAGPCACLAPPAQRRSKGIVLREPRHGSRGRRGGVGLDEGVGAGVTAAGDWPAVTPVRPAVESRAVSCCVSSHAAASRTNPARSNPLISSPGPGPVLE